MLTVGVDLAADAARTALARVRWTPGGARVEGVVVGVDDAAILDAVPEAAKTGIDCPFGWPDLFADFIAAHRTGHVPPQQDDPQWRRPLVNRVTDLVVREQTKLVPLSVAADRIAHPALRCAPLLAELSRRGTDVRRDGTGAVVEVYPAASLRRWNLTHRGYKRAANAARLADLVDALQAAAPWLDLAAAEPLCRTSDDAFDAVIAALTARAATLNQTTTPTSAQHPAALTEGWIALPTGPLAALTQ
ncbi:DUF429 domain-containing protein [Actinomadura parmotrematis]|uniref:DUF429 domain-containing protein n=1 Tax=Actinomadura parmotrematis TaxID=2864039 RepID=A0ABS7G1L1_9ACTN|nr:DUF429 domain-containing protein [Actinomadura parmotrematis]MBW8486583.1 DUF429 domain-containing protein [Actinomadura parmotrematis]